jgi:hypothetical protein
MIVLVSWSLIWPTESHPRSLALMSHSRRPSTTGGRMSVFVPSRVRYDIRAPFAPASILRHRIGWKTLNNPPLQERVHRELLRRASDVVI